MKIITILFLFVASFMLTQNNLPDLNLSGSIDKKNEVQKYLKLKDNDIAVSFYTEGGLAYFAKIDNFIFRKNGDIEHLKEEIFYKNGKRHRKNIIQLTSSQKMKFKEIIHSDLFKGFSKYTQANFKYSSRNHQICNGSLVDDAPENFLMITQKRKQTNIMVYLPKSNIYCSEENSPLMKFVELHNLFNIELDR